MVTPCFGMPGPKLGSDQRATIEGQSMPVASFATCASNPSSVGQHCADIGLGHGRAVHDGVAVKPPHGLAPADAAHVVFDGVAGHHRFTEFALVDSEKINRARFLGALDRLDADHAGGLRHRLDHHHPGIDRTFRKMPLKWRLAEGDVLDADAGVIGPDIEHPIDQQHRIAVRQRLEDLIDIHERKSDRCLLHQSRPSPFGSTVPSRTRRSTATISRNHCLVGFAKKPPQRPLAGMSSLTALIAVTWAPSPMRRWLLIPTLAPNATLSPIVRLPASPIWAASRQCLPIVTLWPIWTWLSILVPSPMTVSRRLPRSIVVPAPTSTSF